MLVIQVVSVIVVVFLLLICFFVLMIFTTLHECSSELSVITSLLSEQNEKLNKLDDIKDFLEHIDSRD